MKQIITALFIALLLPVSVNAAPAQRQAAVPVGQVIHVSVNGMVCDFCAQSITKVLMKDPAVKSVDISLEKKLVTVELHPGKTLDDKTIAGAIDYAGYDLVNIHRME